AALMDPLPSSVGLVTAVNITSSSAAAAADHPHQEEGVWLDGNRHCVFGVACGHVILADLQLAQNVYAYGCHDLVLDVSAGKVNHITLEACANCCLSYAGCIAGIELVSCRDVHLLCTGSGTDLLQCDLSCNVTSHGEVQPRNIVHSNNMSVQLGDYALPTSPYTEQRWTYFSHNQDRWITLSTQPLRDRCGKGIVVLQEPEIKAKGRRRSVG
ncbi:MAG: hypothetical protein KGL42_13655, partial [Betaproteobacteria bacterium]|nr:hypothetical protein [Betaproteobacteria bacterium]